MAYNKEFRQRKNKQMVKLQKIKQKARRSRKVRRNPLKKIQIKQV